MNDLKCSGEAVRQSRVSAIDESVSGLIGAVDRLSVLYDEIVGEDIIPEKEETEQKKDCSLAWWLESLPDILLDLTNKVEQNVQNIRRALF